MRVDQAAVLAPTSDGKWVKYPLSPAGVASSSADRVIYALFVDGTYQSIPDPFVDATPVATGSGG